MHVFAGLSEHSSEVQQAEDRVGGAADVSVKRDAVSPFLVFPCQPVFPSESALRYFRRHHMMFLHTPPNSHVEDHAVTDCQGRWLL